MTQIRFLVDTRPLALTCSAVPAEHIRLPPCVCVTSSVQAGLFQPSQPPFSNPLQVKASRYNLVHAHTHDVHLLAALSHG